MSSGEFIQFLDADDEILPGKLSEQLRIVEGDQADVLVTGYRNRYPDGSTEEVVPLVVPIRVLINAIHGSSSGTTSSVLPSG